jgi:hypothetical protein
VSDKIIGPFVFVLMAYNLDVVSAWAISSVVKSSHSYYCCKLVILARLKITVLNIGVNV